MSVQVEIGSLICLYLKFKINRHNKSLSADRKVLNITELVLDFVELNRHERKFGAMSFCLTKYCLDINK